MLWIWLYLLCLHHVGLAIDWRWIGYQLANSGHYNVFSPLCKLEMMNALETNMFQMFFFREGKLSLFLACVALTGFTTARWAAGEGLQTSWYLPCKLQAICCQSDHKAFFSAALWTSVQPVSAKDYQQLLTNWMESSVNGCLTVASQSLGLCDSWAMSYQIG